LSRVVVLKIKFVLGDKNKRSIDVKRKCSIKLLYDRNSNEVGFYSFVTSYL